MKKNKFKNCGYFSDVIDINSKKKPEIRPNMGIILLAETNEGDIPVYVKIASQSVDKHGKPTDRYTGIVFKIGNDPKIETYAGISLGDEVDFKKENMKHTCTVPKQKA
jgi:hypothetical protein